MVAVDGVPAIGITNLSHTKRVGNGEIPAVEVGTSGLHQIFRRRLLIPRAPGIPRSC